MRDIFLLGALCGVLPCAAGGNLCPNPGFENGTEGWSFRDPSYRVEQGVGIGGSAAMVFDCREYRNHHGPKCEIPAKPGRAYRFSGCIKREMVTNMVQIALVRLTKSGEWITQVIAERTNINAVDGDGWAHFEGETDYLDKDSAFLRLYVYIRNGACGRFLADDFCIEELPEDPLADLHSSAYRNAAFAGSVRFVVPVRVSPVDHDPAGLRAEFAFTDAKGVNVVRWMALAADCASITVDVGDIALGGQTVTCRLIDASGMELDSSSLRFTRLDRAPDQPVYIDGNRRFVVHGKPFFPIAITWGKSIKRSEWQTAIEKLKGGPFNVALIYESELTPADLDFFLSYGLMVKYNLKDVYTGFPKVHPPRGVKTESDEIRHVTEKVNLLKNHQGLFAWYTNDEFPPTMANRVRARHELLHQLDAGHPTVVCLDRPFTVNRFLGGFDVVSSDPYPVGSGKPLRLAADWTRTTDTQIYGLMPMLQTVQAFDWSWFQGSRKDPRFPTYEELRSMTWQQIAEGATGVNFFSYSCIYANLKGEAFDRALGDTVRVAEEVKSMTPVLLSDEPAPRIVSDQKDLSLRSWRYEGNVYLVVCDLSGKGSTPNLRLEESYSAVSCREGAEVSLLGDGSLVLKLPPYGVAVVRLTPER